MSLSGDDRAFAIYKSIAGTSALSGAVDGSGKPTDDAVKQPDGSMGPSEKYRLLTGLRALWGADTSYLQAKAEIAPGSLAAAQGIAVSTPAGPGATSAPGPLDALGRGKLL